VYSVAALASSVVAFFALVLLAPAAAAALTGDWRAFETFAICAATYGFISTLTLLALTPQARSPNRAGVFAAVLAMWAALILSALLPFMMIEKLGFFSALFESVSASVTMGVTYRAPADISAVMGLYRGIVAWTGGLLTLLLAVYVIGRYEVGGTPNRHLRYLLHSAQGGHPRLVKTFFEVFVPYVALTLTCAAILVLVQVRPSDALNLAINVVATNGYVPLQTGASILNNTIGEIILIIFMVLSATSIIWHRTLVTRRWQQSREQAETGLFLIALVAMSILAVIVAIARSPGELGSAQIALNAVFDVVSTMTTTGLVHDGRQGIQLPFELWLTIALVGGCSYSTAGGIKIFRVAGMLHHSANEIRRLVYPHMVLVRSVDSSSRELAIARAVWSATFVALITLAVATLILSAQGIDLARSLSLAVGAFSATGSLVSGAFDTPPDMWTQMTIALVAVLARVEMLIILAVASTLVHRR